MIPKIAKQQWFLNTYVSGLWTRHENKRNDSAHDIYMENILPRRVSALFRTPIVQTWTPLGKQPNMAPLYSYMEGSWIYCDTH